MSKGNEPAFPNMNYEGVQMGGLTKREYYAGEAMKGLVSTLTIGREDYIFTLSETAVQYADALLAELEKEGRV